jgi:hypothetical protein
MFLIQTAAWLRPIPTKPTAWFNVNGDLTVGLPANLDRLNANVGLHWMLYEKSYRKNAKTRRVEKNEKCTEKKKKQEVKNQPPKSQAQGYLECYFSGSILFIIPFVALNSCFWSASFIKS